MAIVKTSALKQDKWILGAIILVLIVLLTTGCYYFNTCIPKTTNNTDNDVIEYFFWKKKKPMSKQVNAAFATLYPLFKKFIMAYRLPSGTKRDIYVKQLGDLIQSGLAKLDITVRGHVSEKFKYIMDQEMLQRKQLGYSS